MTTETKTVEADGAKVILRQNTYAGRITTIHLRAVFEEIYPEFAEQYRQLQIRDWKDVINDMPDGQAEVFFRTLSFCGYCGNIIGATGLPYAWPIPGMLPDKAWVQTAFAHYLVSNDDGIWGKIAQTLDAWGKPEGPKQTWPEESLSKEELADPN